MAIICYTGVMGSGKTYEGVSTAMLTALRQGRRVVTNISGVNFEEVRDYLGAFPDGSHLEPEKIVIIPSKRITEPGFFPDPDLEGKGGAPSVVMGGDLVLIDEVWSFWGSDQKLTPEHQKFFRMHRHYTEVNSGVSCDLVLMIQDLSSLHRFIRGVLESTLKFTKKKDLGVSSAYTIDVYEGSKQTRQTFIARSMKKYDKKIFPLYKSYDGDKKGKEATVDGRHSLFANKWFLVAVAGGMVLMLYSSVAFYRMVSAFLNPEPVKKPEASGAVAPVRVPGAAAGAFSPPVGAVVGPSTSRSLMGVYVIGGITYALVQMPDGRVTQIEAMGGVVDGWRSKFPVDGQFVTFRFASPGAKK